MGLGKFEQNVGWWSGVMNTKAPAVLKMVFVHQIRLNMGQIGFKMDQKGLEIVSLYHKKIFGGNIDCRGNNSEWSQEVRKKIIQCIWCSSDQEKHLNFISCRSQGRVNWFQETTMTATEENTFAFFANLKIDVWKRRIFTLPNLILPRKAWRYFC